MINFDVVDCNPNQAGLFWLCYIGGADSPEISAVIRAIASEILHTRRPGRNLHDCVVRFVKIINYANLFIKLLFSP